MIGLYLTLVALTVPLPVLLSAQTGKVLELNGTDAYAWLNEPLPDLEVLTLELWSFQVQDDTGVIFMDAESDVFNTFLLNVRSDFIGLAANKSGAVLRHSFNPGKLYVTPSIDRAWHHIAWVMEPHRSRVYLDGELGWTVEETGSNVGFHAVRASLGRSFVPGRSAHYRGFIDNFRLWSRALTADEIAAAMTTVPSGEGLLIHYDFEGVGSELVDRSGRGRDAALMGGAHRVAEANASRGPLEEPAPEVIPYRRYMDIPVEDDAFEGGFAVSPDGRTLAAYTRLNTIALWDLETGMETGAFRGRVPFAFVRDGRHILIGTRLWDVESGTQVAAVDAELSAPLEHLIPYTESRVVAIAGDFYGNGAYANVHTWDLDEMVGVGRYFVAGCNTPRGNCINCIGTCNSNLGTIELTVSADGRWAATGRNFSGYQDMALWDSGTGGKKGGYWVGAEQGAAFSPASDRFAYANGKGMRIYSLPSFDYAGQLNLDGVPREWFFIKGNSELLVVGDTWIDRWNVESRERLTSVSIPSQGLETLPSHGLIRPDGSMLATWDGPILRFFSVPDLAFAGGIPSGLERIDEVEFTPDGRYLIARSGRRLIRVWQSTGVPTAVRDNSGGRGNLPAGISLPPAYPNPANPGIWIPFEIAVDGHVQISVFNVSGQLVRTLRLGPKQAASYVEPGAAAFWNGRDERGARVASGVYIYRIVVAGLAATGQVVLLR